MHLGLSDKILTDQDWHSASVVGIGCDVSEEIQKVLCLVALVNIDSIIVQTFLLQNYLGPLHIWAAAEDTLAEQPSLQPIGLPSRGSIGRTSSQSLGIMLNSPI